MDLVERPSTPVTRRHPWEQARRRLIANVLRDELEHRTQSPSTALDIGSGDAWLAEALARDLGLRTVHALDTAYTDQDCRLLQSDLVRPTRTYPPDGCDLVLLLDVIEHVREDTELLHAARGSVSEGGLIMVTVPAWPRLATQHDIALGHHRRYTPLRLRRALAAAGLRPLQMGGAFSSLLGIRAGQRILERARGRRPLPNLGQWGGGAATTRALSAALTWDAEIGRRLAMRNLPAPGLTLWATAVVDT